MTDRPVIDVRHRAGSAYVAMVADYMERMEIALSDALCTVDSLKDKVAQLEADLKLERRKNKFNQLDPYGHDKPWKKKPYNE